MRRRVVDSRGRSLLQSHTRCDHPKGTDMVKTISVAELEKRGAADAIQDAEKAPILISKENRPAAWIVSVERLAEVAAARGVSNGVHERALELLAVELYRDNVLTLGQGATLAGLSFDAFVDLCGRLNVPILWPMDGDLGAEVDAMEAALAATRSVDQPR
jgi:hypothetical protein